MRRPKRRRKEPKCEGEDCETIPSFNVEGTTKGRFCKKHASPGMVNIRSKKCQAEEGCRKQPSFAEPGATAGKYCASHKKAGMTNVADKTCAAPGCNINKPSFNEEGKTQGLFCKLHALDTMVNVVGKLCVEPDCVIRATFNVPGEPGLYCRLHAKKGMVLPQSNQCSDKGCTGTWVFGFKRGDKLHYCGAHRLAGMVDIRNRMCVEVSCSTHAHYGLLGQHTTHCMLHRQAGQITHPRRICEEEDCKQGAQFGIHAGERCEKHKQDTDRDLVLKRCVACNSAAQWDVKSDLCDDCAKRSTNIRLRRQRQVKAWLDKQGDLPKYDFYDKAMLLPDKCGRERPDFAWRCAAYTYFLEIDEYKHEDRSCECEIVRMVNVTQGEGMPCVWIRYNPDDYKGHTSTIRDKHRLEHLVKIIKACLALPPIDSPTNMLRVTHLFFDEFDMTKPLAFTPIPML